MQAVTDPHDVNPTGYVGELLVRAARALVMDERVEIVDDGEDDIEGCNDAHCASDNEKGPTHALTGLEGPATPDDGVQALAERREEDPVQDAFGEKSNEVCLG